jgi:glycosyltransferase involved in cell wall biosynthesis
MSEALIVVPCFNEASRFSSAGFDALLADPRVDALFVDDGSTDATLAGLGAFCARHPERASTLRLPRNGGKGEAVRAGLLEALGRGAGIVGYLDADLSTPGEEFSRLLDELIAHDVDVVMGARVNLLGAQITRDPARHYLGRVFATTASFILDLPVYDTQCGAKLFRAGPTLAAALLEPFGSRWAFDVELLGRLVVGRDGATGLAHTAFREVPLRRWEDVGGSKLGVTAMARSAVDLARIGVELRARRARRRASIV